MKRQKDGARNLIEEQQRRDIFPVDPNADMEAIRCAMPAAVDHTKAVTPSHRLSNDQLRTNRLVTRQNTVSVVESDNRPIDHYTDESNDGTIGNADRRADGRSQIDAPMAGRVWGGWGLERSS